MNKKFRIAILASGSGTNAEAIFKYFKNHSDIDVSLLLTNNAHAYVLERAKTHHIESRIFNRLEFRESQVVLEWLLEKKITHIVLAGFLWLIPDYLIASYPDRIINIHPALLPLYGGKGMYGMKVHQAVKDSGSNESGITIHLVNEKYDEGKIIFQARCTFEKTCTPNDIANHVHALEHAHYPRIIETWILNSSPQTVNPSL